MSKARIAVAALTISAAAFAAWQSREGFTSSPVIPAQGDVPTIGHGSTHYEDGTPVRMSDPTITRKRGEELAHNLERQDERQFVDSLPGVKLNQVEFDEYMDFIGQYGVSNWRRSSIRTRLLAGDYRGACSALLNYRFLAGYDCSALVDGNPNKRCWGVWARQKTRYEHCIASQ